MLRTLCIVAAGLLIVGSTARADDAKSDWVELFNGENMDGWKASENKDSWSVVDGSLVCKGPRSHLFYTGIDKPFKNFEFECEVMTTPGSNAGIYIHTKYQEEGWPKAGQEVQVNITHGDPKKSGSLYGIVDVGAKDLEGLVKDNEWYTTHITVNGRHVTVKINDKTVVDYTEPDDQKPFSAEFDRTLGQGTFALQAHDPESKVMFRNLKVRRLP